MGLPSQRCFAAARDGRRADGSVLCGAVVARYGRLVGVAPASLFTARLLPERLFVELLG